MEEVVRLFCQWVCVSRAYWVNTAVNWNDRLAACCRHPTFPKRSCVTVYLKTSHWRYHHGPRVFQREHLVSWATRLNLCKQIFTGNRKPNLSALPRNVAFSCSPCAFIFIFWSLPASPKVPKMCDTNHSTVANFLNNNSLLLVEIPHRYHLQSYFSLWEAEPVF